MKQNEIVNELRKKYPKGTRIKCVLMKDKYNPVPSGTIGSVRNVDDAGTIHMAWENGSSLALNISEDKFNYLIEVLLVEPGKYPKVIEISDDLETMQSVVGGYIEEYMPFDDDVAIVCNESGKINGEELNRAIYGDNGHLLDIIAGKFFICYAPIESERFLSMPDDLLKKYEKLFKYPERITVSENKIEVKPYKPMSKSLER